VNAVRNWTLRQTYLYLVSFVALMLVVTGLIRTVMAVGDRILPSTYYIPGPAEIYARYQQPDGKPATVPKEVIDQQVAFEIERAKQMQWSGSYNEMRRGLSYVLVALPVWLYHWRKVQKENKLPPNETPNIT
jgi:hypothetical protein